MTRVSRPVSLLNLVSLSLKIMRIHTFTRRESALFSRIQYHASVIVSKIQSMCWKLLSEEEEIEELKRTQSNGSETKKQERREEGVKVSEH